MSIQGSAALAGSCSGPLCFDAIGIAIVSRISCLSVCNKVERTNNAIETVCPGNDATNSRLRDQILSAKPAGGAAQIGFDLFRSDLALYGTQPSKFPTLSAMHKLVRCCLIGQIEIGLLLIECSLWLHLTYWRAPRGAFTFSLSQAH